MSAEGANEEDDLGLGGYVPQTDLGRLTLAARREYLASGGYLLSAEELEREIAAPRGGVQLPELDGQ